MSSAGRGPLTGLKVVEISSIGAGPHCAMLPSDLGAEVLRIERKGGNGWPNPIVDRGRHNLIADVRSEGGRAIALATIDHADVLIEGYRPGVMERLGYGPDEMLARNPRLIYGRMTDWGQTGPLAKAADHDVNYIALTGALAAITDDQGRPIPPADYGQYRRVGLSTSSLRCSSAVGAMRGTMSASAPSSGTASCMLGCGQSVPHRQRSG